MTDTKNNPIDFSDLEDEESLKPGKPSSGYGAKAGFGLSDVDTGERFEEDCPSCRGSGSFYSYTGRYVGPCFKCKGKGKLSFKNPAHVREAQRKARAQKKAADLADKKVAFFNEQPEVCDWLVEAAPTFNFAASLLESLNKYGSLTDRQVEAAKNCIAKRDAARKARKDAEVDIDLSAIRAMFESAVDKGHKKPRYKAEGLVLSRAPDSGRNPGAIYVKNDADVYGGKIVGTTFSPSREALADDFASYDYTDEDGQVVTVSRDAAEALKVIAADPHEAAVKHGRRTGNCAICSRQLTKGESIDRGIGPICAAKYGFI